MKRVFGLLLLLLLVIFGLSFAVLNADPVTFNYYFGSTPIPLSLIVVAALAIGATFGVLASLTVVIRYKTRIVQLNRRLGHLEADFSRHKPRDPGPLSVR